MSRKNKILRTFLHQNQSPTIAQAWDAAWKHAQKTFHARSMRDMKERLDAAQADVEALRAEVVKLRNLRADAVHECALANIRAELMAEALESIQRVATSRNVRTDIQAATALGCIAVVCDVTLTAYRNQENKS